MSRLITDKKKNGVTFTPEHLAEFLSRRILQHYPIKDPSVCVLDPACGNGMLLTAINNVTGNILANIIGYDTDDKNLKIASARINQDGKKEIGRFYNDDFLTICPNCWDLFSSKVIKRDFADIIIANPPYVRTQVLGAEKTKQLAKDFGLKGRLDLYYPFFMAMTNALKVGGIMGVITSNRYLFTKSGADIRKFLYENFEIIEIIDLGDTKLFEAAVLPAIFIGKKKGKKDSQNLSIKYSSIYECAANDKHSIEVASIFDILQQNRPGIYNVEGTFYKYKIGHLKESQDKSAIWQLENSADSSWIDVMEANSSFRIKERFKVRVGLKSCADNVFIAQMWDKYGIKIEQELLRPMLSQENIEAWRINRNKVVNVLYPHYAINGKKKVYDLSKYPNARKYLEIYREQLEKRTYLIKAKRNWYEYWVPQNPCFWGMPKIIFPDISLNPRFCFDNTGSVVNGNCYWICAQSEEEENLLYLIEGVCNSRIMTKYHDIKFPNKLYSGRRRYLSQYIEEYPIPNPLSEESKQIITIVKTINSLSDEETIRSLALDIDKLVEKAFGLRD